MIDIPRHFGGQQFSNLVGDSRAESFKDRADPAVRIADNLGGPVFMIFFGSTRLLHSLQGVAEGPMPEIVQKRGELARRMEHAYRVRETRVGRPRKGELGNAELANPAEPLKFRRIEKIPGSLITASIGPFRLEHDQPVDGVADPLLARLDHA